MASVINTNIASLNTQRNLASSQMSLQTSLQRLSSGLRINGSKDDAAGLAIATKMDSQIRGQQVAIRNANDAISFAQTAEGGLAKQTDAIQRMRELAVQSANATNGSADRTNLDAEFTELKAEVLRLNSATKFNGSAVFGSAAKVYQVGADTTDTISVTGTTALTTATGSITSASGATAAITALDAALVTVNTARAKLGAVQNRFESVVSNLQVSVENQSAAKSRIMDADFAAETANLTRGQILQQAGTAMLAQANSLPNGVLALLRG
jgi:flagellin